jgi:galactose-1-phosphate uridylyltransferase
MLNLIEYNEIKKINENNTEYYEQNDIDIFCDYVKKSKKDENDKI